MKPKSSIVARKLLNLYRQEHVIFGGWTTVNRIFVDEATPDVLEQLATMPTGKLLVRHIENLRSGKTQMNTIEHDLLPYGGMMAETVATVPLAPDELTELQNGLNQFTPDTDGLDRIQRLGVVQRFGDEWLVAIRSAIADKPELLEKWSMVTQTYRAYYLWKVATDIIDQPINERVRAQLQADMPEYETFLPMFGDAGNELLAKLRTYITTIKHPDSTFTN